MNLCKRILFFNPMGRQTIRSISPYQSHMQSTHNVVNKEAKLFHDTLPCVIESVVGNAKVPDIPDLDEWIKKLLSYNLTGGKAARGMTVVMAYEMLEQPDKLTEESMKLARTLGWCFEMAFMCIVDDIMDGSPTRRGKPCWYRLPDVGSSCAVNDGVMVYSCMFYLLRKHFGDRPRYTDMLNAIHETMLYSTFGQFLDHKTSELMNKDYILFTNDRHLTINKYKTAFYTYNLPTTLGMLLADYKVDENTKKIMQEVCLELGLLFQIQDDYMDCFGDEELTGKFGTDIQEGKCSWLAVNALQRCTPPQRIVFGACYGSKEPAHYERVTQLYRDLKLPELYKEVEKGYYNDISQKIQRLPTCELKRLFHRLLVITHQRQK